MYALFISFVFYARTDGKGALHLNVVFHGNVFHDIEISKSVHRIVAVYSASKNMESFCSTAVLVAPRGTLTQTAWWRLLQNDAAVVEIWMK